MSQRKQEEEGKSRRGAREAGVDKRDKVARIIRLGRGVLGCGG